MPSRKPLSIEETAKKNHKWIANQRKLVRRAASLRQAQRMPVERTSVKAPEISQSDPKTEMPLLDEGKGKGAKKTEDLNQRDYSEFKGDKKHET
jgi:hypothetical protein